MQQMYLFTLHDADNLTEFNFSVISTNPYEAAALAGGQFIEREGGICNSSRNIEELGLCGFVRFRSELFQKTGWDFPNTPHKDMVRCYKKGNFKVYAERGKAVEMLLRRHCVLLPDCKIPPKEGFVFTLHYEGKDRFKCAIFARNPHEAASLVGAEFVNQRDHSVSERREFKFLVGTVNFRPELFREMDETDVALAGMYACGEKKVCYTEGIGLLVKEGGGVDLKVYRRPVIAPNYI